MGFVRFISVSQEDTYHGCPYRYFLERVQKLRRVTTAQMLFGQAMHAALETFNRGWRAGIILPMETMLWTLKQEMGHGMGPYWEFRARVLLGLYIDQVAPSIVPDRIEEQFYLPMPGMTDVVLTGVIDAVTRSTAACPDPAVVDYKVSRVLEDPADKMQETGYALAYARLVGKSPLEGWPGETYGPQFWRVSLLRDEDPARITREVVVVRQKDIDEFWNRMLAFARGLKARSFPKHPKSRRCHPLFCPFYVGPCDRQAPTGPPTYATIYGTPRKGE